VVAFLVKKKGIAWPKLVPEAFAASNTFYRFRGRESYSGIQRAG
jgi:hypothetical protein